VNTDVVATNWRKVSVTFRKQVSDGAYGTEAAEVYLEDYINPRTNGDLDEQIAQDLLDEARDLAHRQLAKSPSERVRKAVEVYPLPPYIKRPDDVDDDDMPLDWPPKAG